MAVTRAFGMHERALEERFGSTDAAAVPLRERDHDERLRKADIVTSLLEYDQQPFGRRDELVGTGGVGVEAKERRVQTAARLHAAQADRSRALDRLRIRGGGPSERTAFAERNAEPQQTLDPLGVVGGKKLGSPREETLGGGHVRALERPPAAASIRPARSASARASASRSPSSTRYRYACSKW
jgi:hypothetical protein